MTTNFSDLDLMVKSFAEYRLLQEFPNLDLQPGSPAADLLLRPYLSLMRPVIQRINHFDLVMNLNNADMIPDRELDELALGNYGLRRKPGARASGTLHLYTKVVPDSGDVVIPAGSVASKGTQRYLVKSDTLFTQTDLALYYATGNLRYELPVEVAAESVGTVFNTGPNTITIWSSTSGTLSISGCSNALAFTDGQDRETNALLAQRCKNYWAGLHPGTDAGYRQQLVNNFAEVADVKVAGKGDPLMNRDLLAGQHIGGAVDLWVKGKRITTRSQSQKLTEANPTVAVTLAAMTPGTATGVTAGTKYFVYTWTNAVGETIIGPSASIDVTIGQSITVTPPAFPAGITGAKIYEGTAGGGPFYRQGSVSASGAALSVTTEPNSANAQPPSTNTTGARVVILSAKPLFEITSVTAVDLSPVTPPPPRALTFSDYSVAYVDADASGGPGESCRVTILSSYNDGETLTVTYTVNELINDISTMIVTKEMREVAKDVLIRDAVKNYLYVKADVRMRIGKVLGTFEQTVIAELVKQYLDGLSLGGTIQESEIVRRLLASPTVATFMESISLPFGALYAAPSRSDAMGTAHNTTITQGTNSYTVLWKLVVTAV